jgi:fumarate hydratase subunit beta
MEHVRSVTLPVTEAEVRRLVIGDIVSLDGEITITAGLPTHHRMVEYMRQGRELPIDIDEQAFFHLGSFNRETADGFEVLYMNPTTSTRFNPVMPDLIRHHRFRMVGGKGGLDTACAAAMREVGCVYLSFIGGACALYCDAIEGVVAVAWNDLISHYRLVKLRVRGLGPLVVAIDSRGGDIYDQCSRAAQERLDDIVTKLDEDRGQYRARS